MAALAEIFERRRRCLRATRITIEQWRVLEEISTEHFIPSMFARSQRQARRRRYSKILRQLLDSGLVSAAIGRDGPQESELQADRERTSHAAGSARRRRQAAIEAVWTGFSRDELASFSTFASKLSIGSSGIRAEEWTAGGGGLRNRDFEIKSLRRRCGGS